MAESKITYVLALDVTKVTEGFKKVQEVEAVLNKNLHVLSTDLGKIGESTWIAKAFGGTANANQKVLELAKAMQTLKETASRDYAARAIHSQDIVALLTKEKVALESLRKAALGQTQKGTFSQGLADASKSITNIQQQIDYHDKLAKSMEKELYALEEITRKKKLLAEIDQRARKVSATETMTNLLTKAPKVSNWKASDILTANEVKILETNVQRVKDAVSKLTEKNPIQQPSFKGATHELDGMVFGTAKALNSYKSNLKEAETLLTNFYKKQEDLRLANASKAIQLPQLSGLKASESIFANKEVMLTQEKAFIAKQEATDNALYNSMKKAIVNQASLETEKQTLHKQSIQNEIARRAELVKQIELTTQISQKFFTKQTTPSQYDPSKSPFASASFKPYIADLQALEAEHNKLGKLAWEAIQAKGREVSAEKTLIKELDIEIAKKQQLAAGTKKYIDQQMLGARPIGLPTAKTSAFKLSEDTSMFGTKLGDSYFAKQAKLSEETSIQRKKDEQELANFLLKQEEELLAKMRSRWNTFANEQKQFEQAELARVAKLATDELKVKGQALTAYNQAISNNANAMKQMFQANSKLHSDALTLNAAYDKTSAKIQTLIDKQNSRLRSIEATTKATKEERDATIKSLLARKDLERLSQITQQSLASAKLISDNQVRLASETSSRQQQIEQQRISWAESAKLSAIQKVEAQNLASIKRIEAADKARIDATIAREQQIAAHKASMLQTAKGGIYDGASFSGVAKNASTGSAADLRATADKQTGLIKGMYETQTAYNQRVKEAIALQEKHKEKLIDLDKVHKPFLERIFDLVVGYKLINAAVNTFTNALRSVPEAGLQFETTYATLKAVFSVTTKVNQELKFLDELAQSAGISIDTLRSSFVDFAASAKFSGEKVENIQEIFANISKAGMVLHLPADKMKSAFTALNQMYAKNQVMMEELKRQLGNQLPAAVNIFALSMGKTTRQLMDDMKKGLVVPKETILNFSRTYAAMFADPASLEYASQGVNAHIQRLSTAWTNFATRVYKESQGAIKGGLSIATAAIDFLTKHMTGLANITVVAGVALGGALIMHLGKATVAYMQASKAVIAFAAAQTTMLGTSVAVSELSLWQTIKNFTTGALAAIPPWVKLVAIIGTAIMVLKDLEVGTTKVISSMDKLDGKATEVQRSITVGDVVLGSWDLLTEKAEKYWNLVKENVLTPISKDIERERLIASGGKQPKESLASQAGSLLQRGFPIATAVVKLSYNKAEQKAQLEATAEEAARQTEYVNEKVKEALLAGTTGTVEQTMEGMNKTVTIALQRITTEFDIATQRLQGQTSLRVKELQLEITKVQSQEALGTITKGKALSQTKNLQDEIYKANKKALADENALLKEQLHRVELVGDAKLENSNQAKLAATQEAKLFKLREARANIVGILPTLQGSPYSDKNAAEKALGSGTVSQELKTRAVEEWNKANPTKPLFDKIDVTNTAIIEQTKALDKARDEYAKITTEHNALQLRVAEGTTTSNDFLKKIATNTDPSNVQQVETTTLSTAGLSNTTATDSAKQAIDFFISKGWKPAQAMGITASLQAESGFNPSAIGDGGQAYGNAQWHPDRQANFAKAFGKSIKGSSQQEQWAFVDWELKNTEARAGELLKATSTVADAVNVVTASYERPKYTTKDQAVRRDIAKTYLPSAGYVKSGADPIAQNALEIQRKLEANVQKGKEQDIEKQQADVESAKATLLASLADTKATLQASLQLTKTQKETELAKLDNSVSPLTEKQRSAKTSAINIDYETKLLPQIDALIKNTKDTLGRTVEEATKLGLSAEIIGLEKERAGLSAEVLKDKATMELNKILPLQDALARRQFEIQKSLEESLGIYNEKTILQQQDLNNEELIKLVYQEKLRLADKNSGLTAEEVTKNTELLAIMDKQVKQLSQVELMKARLAKAEETTGSKEGLAQAKLANTDVVRFGSGGRFSEAMAKEAWAKQSGAALKNTYDSELSYNKKLQETSTGSELDKLQTRAEELTGKLNELKTAKDAVFEQASKETIDSIGNAFVDWANGAQTAREAFRNVAIDFAKMVQEILMNELKMMAMKGVMSLISGGIGGMSGGGSLGSTGATSAIGIAGFATGGDVRGTGTGTSDSIPSVVPIGSYVLNAKASAKAKKARLIKLSHGEVVISPEQVAQLGLDNLNTMNTQGYATGGLVGGTATSSSAKPTGKNSNVYNINVAVPEGTSNPQQFGKDTGVEIYKAIAREEAKKELNRYNKMKTGGH